MMSNRSGAAEVMPDSPGLPSPSALPAQTATTSPGEFQWPTHRDSEAGARLPGYLRCAAKCIATRLCLRPVDPAQCL
jgi:hypothetical protein